MVIPLRDTPNLQRLEHQVCFTRIHEEIMYRTITADSAPRRGRKSTSRFEQTPEWEALHRDLSRGLKPGKMAEIILTEEELTGYGISNERTVLRFIQKYIDKHELGYEVRSVHKDGALHVLISE